MPALQHGRATLSSTERVDDQLRGSPEIALFAPEYVRLEDVAASARKANARELRRVEIFGEPPVAEAGEDGFALRVEVVETHRGRAFEAPRRKREARVGAAHRQQRILREIALGDT